MAFAYLDDLRSLWEIDLPEQPRHQHARREYELRRAEATTAAFERLEVLGPVIVEVKLSEDLLAARTLALSLKPRRAELRGEQAEVLRQLLDGRKSRLVRVDTPEARKKRRQRDPKGDIKVHWSRREESHRQNRPQCPGPLAPRDRIDGRGALGR